MITLLIGGARAGKSTLALSLGESQRDRGPLLFVATAQPFDEEMRIRIHAHHRERGAHWKTLEAPNDVASDLSQALSAEPQTFAAIVLDCLTLWVSNTLLLLPEDVDAEAIIAQRTRALVDVLEAASHAGTTIVIVTNEVGLGVVPPTPLGRRFRDGLGRANQLVAAAADEVSLVVAGLAVQLKAK